LSLRDKSVILASVEERCLICVELATTRTNARLGHSVRDGHSALTAGNGMWVDDPGGLGTEIAATLCGAAARWDREYANRAERAIT
jgi:hypothetical protein